MQNAFAMSLIVEPLAIVDIAVLVVLNAFALTLAVNTIASVFLFALVLVIVVAHKGSNRTRGNHRATTNCRKSCCGSD